MQKTKKRRINMIDLILLVTLFVVLAVVVSHFVGAMRGGSEVKQIRYVLEVSQIQSEFCAKAAEGDPILDYESAVQLGRVTATSAAPAYYKGVDTSGKIVYTEIDGYNVLYITIEAEAELAENGYIVNGRTVNAGTMMTVRLPNLYCEAECISVSVIN